MDAVARLASQSSVRAMLQPRVPAPEGVEFTELATRGDVSLMLTPVSVAFVKAGSLVSFSRVDFEAFLAAYELHLYRTDAAFAGGSL